MPLLADTAAPPRPASNGSSRMIRLGLMLERSRADDRAFIQPVGARRARRDRDMAIWYLGDPFSPRRAAGSLDR